VQASIFLARPLGAIFLLPSVFILTNSRAVGSMTLIYLFGLVDFAAGLAIVLTHNVWVTNWRVLITLIGWLMLMRGAVRIAAPDQIKGYAAKVIRNQRIYPVTGAVAVIFGLIFCYFGYRA
jgi:hypothetical protein